MATAADMTAGQLAETRARLVVRVAELAALEVHAEQIAPTVGLAVPQVRQLLEAEDTKAEIARIRGERYDQQKRLNVGWDAVEEDAVGQVLEYMMTTKDPEYALRAARAANQAQRRGPSAGSAPTIQGGVAAAAVINLSAVFVEKLQSMRVGMRELDIEAHRVDALPLQEAEKLLAKPVDETVMQLADIFKGVEIS